MGQFASSVVYCCVSLRNPVRQGVPFLTGPIANGSDLYRLFIRYQEKMEKDKHA
jgi:hypothetical protein